VNLQRSGRMILASILWSLAFSAMLASLAACSTLSKADETSTAPLLPAVPTKASTPTRRPSPTVRVVHTSIPTVATPSRTATPAVTPSPTQPLSSDGPYLAYIKGEGEYQQLILRDQDSLGALAIPAPPSSRFEYAPSSFSPDGKWLAFCGGSPEPNAYGIPPSGPYDLSLYLMHIPDGTIRKITGLLSPDYPDNFKRQAELLQGTRTPLPDYYEIPASGLEEYFGSLCIFNWSHDGKKLAFSGEMDGPSWDLYVYDMNSGKISRMSSGLENVIGMSWSPSDDYILHWSAIDVCEGGCERWWIAPMNGGKISELTPPGNIGMGWASDTAYKVYTGANGLGSGFIYDLDILTNKATEVWPHQFDAYVTDPETGLVGVGVESYEEGVPQGFYLYNPQNGALRKILDGALWDVEYWGNGEFSFLVTSDESGNVAVRPDGTYKKLGGTSSWNYVSPDCRWIAMRTAHTQPGVKLYTPDGQTLVIFPDTAYGIIWRPDSAGFYYMTEDTLFYVPIEDPHPRLVDTGLPNPYDSFPAWVP
jgi:Tol biopolymer transport system component